MTRHEKLLLQSLEVLEANCDCGDCGPCLLSKEIRSEFTVVKGREKKECRECHYKFKKGEIYHADCDGNVYCTNCCPVDPFEESEG